MVRSCRPGHRYGRLLKLGTTRKGYRLAQLTRVDPLVQRSVTVHSLVARAFIGPRPSGYQVNHKDGQKQNNCVANLEYVTPQDNMAHAVRHGLKARGERSAKAKLTEVEVTAIFHGTDNTIVTGRLYGVSHQTVRAIRRREIWRHLNLHHEVPPGQLFPADTNC